MNSKHKWETLCNKCGICCYEKIIIHGRVYINLDKQCQYLDMQTKTCKVYENRFRQCKDCKKLTIWHALFASYLPESCGYVKKHRFWKFPRPRYSHGYRVIKRKEQAEIEKKLNQ